MKYAILGFGSLLWDEEPSFDKQHKTWSSDGPKLKLEFSQIADAQEDGIALVIDPKMGELCQVAYTLSKRSEAADVICDLRAREETVLSNIGYLFRDGPAQYRDAATANGIWRWAMKKQLDGVIWTDTPSNFESVTGRRFSVKAALAYIRGLSPKIKAEVADYVWKAPDFVNTPLRRALQTPPWFAAKGNRKV